ncbi:MAG: hypothetical protein H0U50_12745 [Pyrinomonadaceae bacterium]|nr:hypothetical protein [Pyrinomonadaceae bacterium]
MTQAGIYFLARNPDQSFKLKFYDFADEQIKDTPGEYKIPSNLMELSLQPTETSCYVRSSKKPAA